MRQVVFEWAEEEPFIGPIEPPCTRFKDHRWRLVIEEGQVAVVPDDDCDGAAGSCVAWIEKEDLGGDLGRVSLTTHVERGGYPEEVSYVWVEVKREEQG